ncbi:MAG: hypothetical protein ACRDA3_15160 [Peptostreptococcaceae bacterium]
MNNISNLYNIELRRIYKWLLALVGLLISGNIFVVVSTIVNVINEVVAKKLTKFNIDLLKSQEAKDILAQYQISNMKQFMNLLLGLCVLICLAYALVIWYRDVFGKSKTGYTLFMLPQNKINVYIAKALTVITMVYIIMLTQIVLFIISFAVMKSLAGFSSVEMYYILNPRFKGLTLIQPHFIDFIMINIIGVILAVVVIFTGVMIQKSFNIYGIILGVVYIVGSVSIFFYLAQVAKYTDELLLYHVVYYIALFLVSVGLSYTLINKRVCI